MPMLSLIRIQKLYNYEENQMSLMEMISDFFPLKKAIQNTADIPPGLSAVFISLLCFYVIKLSIP